MYFYVKYQSSLPPIAKRPTDLSDQRSTTDTIRLPYQTYSFTCYPHAIPRLPFSIINESSDQSVERDYPSERTSLTQHATRSTNNNHATSLDSIPIKYPTPEQLRHSNLKTKKKYKPVAQKVRGIIGEMPEKFRVIRNIVGDPLENMPILSPNPPPFVPTGRYTAERKAIIDKMNPGFLLPAERDLLHHLMMLQEAGFAWEDKERGHFREDFFPPVDMPVVPHTPWVLKNIPIPPGLYDEVCAIIRKKIEAGVFEPSSSSYRSRWFCVVKKDGKSLRIVQSLEPLNAVTIQQSGVPPLTDQLAEHFAGRACGTILDLFVG